MRNLSIKKTLDVLIMVALVVLLGYFVAQEFMPRQYTYIEHRVTSGETCYEIAKLYGSLSTEKDLGKIVWDIRQKNGLTGKYDLAKLQPGQVLIIPIQK